MEIVILDSGYKSYDFEKELFRKNNCILKIFPFYAGDRDAKMKFAIDADGILVRHTVIDDHFLSGMKKLKAIVRYGVGYDNIDIQACTQRGIRVANVQGYANNAVSDHAMALMFICCRAMWNTGAQLLSGFAVPPCEDVFELHDKTLGIIGLGRIGSVFASKTLPLFRRIIAADPYKPQEHFERLKVQQVSIEELFRVSDVISIHCNLTDETKHLLNREAFNSMKNRPVIINTSRGGVINEPDLLVALDAGKIHSAGLDVYEDEPLTDRQSRFVNHSRMVCTGHYAWYSDYSAIELQKRASINLLNLLKGLFVEDSLN